MKTQSNVLTISMGIVSSIVGHSLLNDNPPEGFNRICRNIGGNNSTSQRRVVISGHAHPFGHPSLRFEVLALEQPSLLMLLRLCWRR